MTITDEMIDRAGQALRERMQASKKLNEWPTLPKSAKRKWLDHAKVALEAALSVAS